MVEARRIRWIVVGACVFGLLSIVAAFLAAYLWWFEGWRFLAVAVCLFLWGLYRFRRPYQFLLRPSGRLEIHRFLGGVQVLESDEVRSEFGSIVLLRSKRRLKVGIDEFEGAAELHRALQAHQTAADDPTSL